MISYQHITGNKSYVICLTLSIMIFIFKAIHYALIGSNIPFVFITIMLIMFYFANRSSLKNLNRMLKFWGLLIILWAVIRFVIEFSFLFSESITETHIREQFTIYQKTISFFMLLAGSYIIKKRFDFVNNSQ